ncbi:MAG: ABC transporter ATP-binding protein [Desulfitobacteriaceae bacterium]
MLIVKDLQTWYGRIQALRGVTFHVEEGEILAVIGANGVGKSTLLNTIAGLIQPREGKVLLEGKEVQGRPAEEMVQKGVILVPERRRIFQDLSVYDNLILGGYHRFRRDRKEIPGDVQQVYTIFPILEKYAHRSAGTLSGGEQQMLAIGRGLMAKPKIILLDEPSLGLAPLLVKEIMSVLAELNRIGVTVILVEQNARAALSIAKRACVMDRGEVVFEGTGEDLLQQDRMRDFYVGKKRRED